MEGDESTVDEATEPEPSAEQIAEELDELGRAQRERDEYLDSLRRVQADFENYRKRMLREQTALVERATEGLVEQLLPVLDSFELALDNLDASKHDDLAQVRKGLELLYAELLGVLEKSGLSRVEAVGKPFDPNEHEAVAQEAASEGDGDGDGEGDLVVSEVFRTGYRLKGRVLRPASVKVKR